MYVLCIVYDKLANKYSSPMLFENVDCGKRYFTSLCKNKCAGVKDDYEFYYVANYDVDNGTIEVNKNKELIEKGICIANEEA